MIIYLWTFTTASCFVFYKNISHGQHLQSSLLKYPEWHFSVLSLKELYANKDLFVILLLSHLPAKSWFSYIIRPCCVSGTWTVLSSIGTKIHCIVLCSVARWNIRTDINHCLGATWVGSICAFLLFNLYVNDFRKYVDKAVDMYACILQTYANNIKTVENKLTEILAKVAEWMKINKPTPPRARHSELSLIAVSQTHLN